MGADDIKIRNGRIDKERKESKKERKESVIKRITHPSRSALRLTQPPIKCVLSLMPEGKEIGAPRLKKE
jgi:hypothetical protein